MLRTLTTILLGLLGLLGAAEPTWSAAWIAPPEQAGANAWIAYRGTVDLAQVPSQATVRIACDSKYWLWVNGRLVVFEGQLKRGPTPQDTYFDRVDLAPHLTSGRNTLAILVWHFGKAGFSHQPSGMAGLVVEGDGPLASLRSGTTWRARRHPAFGQTQDEPNFRLPESHVRFDARQDLTGWTEPAYDDQSWPAAVALGTPPCAPWNRLVERPIPLWHDGGLTPYPVTTPALPTSGEALTITAKLPANLQVTPWLDVEAPAGLTIDIRTDHFLGGGPPNVRSEYITRAGRQQFESPAWFNGHEVRYTVPAGVRVLGLQYRETRYDADVVGRFASSDPDLDRLWAKSLRTLQVTMRDTYMDCPDRERAQWWGDAVNELGEAFYVFDAQRGPLLARKGMLELAAWQRPDGSLFSPVPAAQRTGPTDKRQGVWDKELPQQMLASISWYGFALYHRYTADDATIATVYPAVRRYLAIWKQGADGLVEHRRGGWDWADWGSHQDVPVLDNAWFALALRGAMEMAPLAGHPEDVAGYQARLTALTAGFDAAFWRGDAYRSPGKKGPTDDRAQAMAVVAGLAKPAYFSAIRAILQREEHASPYLEKYVLEALCLMDAPDEAVVRMKRRYAEMLASPLSTLWEGWGIGAKGFGGGTANHAWSGGPLTILSQYLAGVAPGSPGWASAVIRPRPGSLATCSATVPTPRGSITVTTTRQATGGTLIVTLPEGLPATISPPVPAGVLPRLQGPTAAQGGDGTPDRPWQVTGGTWTITWGS